MNGKWIAIASCVGLLACGPSASDDVRAGGAESAAATANANAWGFTFTAPEGYRSQDRGSFTYLGSPEDASLIVLGRANFATTEDALGALQSFGKDAKLTRASVVEAPAEGEVAGQRALTATFGAFTSNGVQVVLRYVTIFSEFETSLGILGVTTPDRADRFLPKIAELADSVKVSAPVVDARAPSLLAGKWTFIKSTSLNDGTATGSSSTGSYVFDAAGSYAYHYEGSVDVFVSGTDGSLGSQASSFSQDDEQGSYRVIGGQLVLAGTKGRYVYAIAPSSDGGVTIGTLTYYRDGG